MLLDHTHDPALTSWVESANAPDTDFPIQNLPHGVFRRRGSYESFRGGVAIGDCILDIAAAAAQQLFAPALRDAVQAASADALNGLMALGPSRWHALRAELSRLLRHGAPEAQRLRHALVPQAQAEYTLPARVGDYTDFSASRHHMANAGAIFQPGAPPLPHFDWLPIAYHGRSSTLEVSGAAVHRPCGQTQAGGNDTPRFGPTRQLGCELELALWVGPGNARGQMIDVDRAEQHLFGISLLNDWSARDVQAHESVPLGPFLSKNFLTSVSPWIVTLAALEPFRCALPPSLRDDAPLPHLRPSRADAGSTCSSKRGCKRPMLQQCACRAAAFGIATGPRRSWWRTTHRAAAACAAATCWVPARRAARSPASKAACWSSRAAVRCRSNCPVVRAAAIWKTATRSSCAPGVNGPVRRASASANAAQR